MSDLGMYMCIPPDCTWLVHVDLGIRELFVMDPNATSGHPKIPSVHLIWLSPRTSTAQLLVNSLFAGLLIID